MFEALRRLFSRGSPVTEPGWDGIEPWAAAQAYTYREVPGAGFVISSRASKTDWNLEWGPSQRPYISGQELRIRAEPGLPPDLQLVLMNRALQVAMESAVFEQFIDGVQTHIDQQTPPEMRWLVMIPPLSGQDMPLLRERFVALSNFPAWLLQWLNSPLTPILAGLRVPAEQPFVLMIGRGRLTLRTAVADAQITVLRSWLRVFDSALHEAQRLADGSVALQAQPSPPSQWPPGTLPGAPRGALPPNGRQK